MTWWHGIDISRYSPCSAPEGLTMWRTAPDSKVHGANMEPIWVLSAPDEPHVGPMNLAIRGTFRELCTRFHDDVIKWKHFPRYWSFVRGIHRSPVNSPHKGQWRGALMFSLIWINAWVNTREAGDLRRYRSHYDVTVMSCSVAFCCVWYSRFNPCPSGLLYWYRGMTDPVPLR